MRTEADEEEESARMLARDYSGGFAEFRADMTWIHPGISLARVIELSQKYRPAKTEES